MCCYSKNTGLVWGGPYSSSLWPWASLLASWGLPSVYSSVKCKSQTRVSGFHLDPQRSSGHWGRGMLYPITAPCLNWEACCYLYGMNLVKSIKKVTEDLLNNHHLPCLRHRSEWLANLKSWFCSPNWSLWDFYWHFMKLPCQFNFFSNFSCQRLVIINTVQVWCCSHSFISLE